MTSGLSNDDKSKIRQLYAEGKATRAELLEAEAKAYHGPGTCTFYGTANTNQMLMEIMGLHLPGASFVNPNTPLRDALTELGARRALELTANGNALHADRPCHRRARGRQRRRRAACDRRLDQPDDPPDRDGGGGGDRAELGRFRRSRRSDAAADAHLSQRQGRREPFPGGRRHAGADPRAARRRVCCTPTRAPSGARGSPITSSSRCWQDGGVAWRPTAEKSGDESGAARRRQAVPSHRRLARARGAARPRGHQDLGRRAGAACHRGAGARVPRQEELQAAFRAGELDRDVVLVVRFQGPNANGMPELHKLMPPLGVLQDRGHKVALVTDGRLSGASGKVPAAMHVTPEAAAAARSQESATAT